MIVTETNHLYVPCHFRLLSFRFLWLFFLALSLCHGMAVEADRVLLRQHMPRVPVHVITEAKIGDPAQKCLLMLDTGAAYLCLDLSFEMRPHSTIGKTNIVASDGSSKEMILYAGPTLRVGRSGIQRPTTLQTDMTSLSRYTGHRLSGIIGMETLGRGKVLIDNDAGFFEVHDGPWRLNEKIREVDLEKDELITVFGGEILGQTGKFIVDSGSDDCIDLQQEIFDRLVAEGAIETAKTDARALSIRGISRSTRGWFLKGEFMGKSLVGVSVKANPGLSILGLSWLYGFNTEIDFSARKMRYQLRLNTKPPSSVQLMTGAILFYKEGGALVESLRPGGGAAEDVGLKAGDIIEEFGALKARDMNAASLGETVADGAGKEIAIRYLRKADGEYVNAKLKLPPTISEWDFAGRDIFKGK